MDCPPTRRSGSWRSTLADEVRAAGAHPVLVTNSLATLDAAVDTLNSGATPDASEVYGWHVDVTTNEVVVQAAPGATDAALAWLESTGVDSTLVRIEVSTEAPQLFYDIIGGYPYYPGNSRCSIGFSVSGGFVTAGGMPARHVAKFPSRRGACC